jgi:uncharacterized membrane protein/protein-disulfide isomerase
MAAPNTHPRDGVLRGGVAALVRVLILVAAGISAYLLSVSLSGGSVAGCGPGSDCDAVLQSRWAYVLGVPVSALALVVDLALLLTTFSCGTRAKPEQRARAWEILLPCAVLVLGAALWFTGLQAVVIKRFCPWCMTAHACGGVAAVLLFMRLPLRDPAAKKEQGIPRDRAVKITAMAATVFAMFAVAQVAVAPKTFSVSTVAAGTGHARATNAPFLLTNAPAAKPAAGVKPAPAPVASTPAPPAPSPVLDVYGGAVKLDLGRTPLWGDPLAPHKMVSLYDYTCHHCAQMHPRVVEVFRAFSNRLAVVSLPMPLDGQCNSIIQRTPRAHQGACNYARIGLAVWRAKREALEPFDDWMFEQFHLSNRPPGLVAATNKAVELVGAASFETAARDPLVEQLLTSSIAIYSIGGRQYGKGAMPQFIISTNILTGTPETAELRALVERHVNAR